MPKVPSSRMPYRLSLPSPMATKSFHHDPNIISSPATPSPPSKLPPTGPLHAFANAPTPCVKQEDTTPHISPSTFPFNSRLFLRSPGAEAVLNEKGELNLPQDHRAVHPLGRAPGIQASHQPRGTSGDDGLAPADRKEMPAFGKLRPLTNRASGTARQKLRHSQAGIAMWKERVECLERSERRLRSQVAKMKESVKDTKAEMEASRTELTLTEEKLDEMKAAMVTLKRDYDRYRGWWLTENRSLKVALREVPKRKWDSGLEAIALSSHGRYMSYSSEGSN